MKNLERNAELICPISKALGAPLESNKNGAAAISALLPFCRPSAVAWLVVAVVVDTVQRVRRARAQTHVADEAGVGLFPSAAHGNSSFAIVGVSEVLWIVASVSHLLPDAIFFCRRRPFSSRFGCGLCGPSAAARPGFSCNETVGRDGAIRAAIAYAGPITSMSPRFGARNDRPQTVPLPGEIAKCGVKTACLFWLTYFSPPGCRPPIASLRRPCRPAAVFRAVRLVVALPFQRVFWRGPPSHILNELLKRGTPGIADRDPSSAVVLVIVAVRIVAAVLHGKPDAILWDAAEAVPKVSLRDLFGTQAPTAMSPPVSEGFSPHRFASATIANTVPQKTSSAVAAKEFYNQQPPEAVSGQVDKPCMRWQRWLSRIVHVSDSHEGSGTGAGALTRRRLTFCILSQSFPFSDASWGAF